MEEKQIQLPLIKRQETFDLIVTEELEKKIRFLCDKLPRNEYSGTLFYAIEGSFKDKNLRIIAKDFFLQDIGEATYTEFQNDVDLAEYMAYYELWEYYTGLMHSHQSFQAFFSGTDIATLREEGKDTNHFVSLIVNNKGEYCAAITRKVTVSIKGDETISYNSFNNEAVDEKFMDFERTESYIEYYMLNVIMPEPIPKSDLELRLEKLRGSIKSVVNRKYSSAPNNYRDTNIEVPHTEIIKSPLVIPINKEKEENDEEQVSDNNNPKVKELSLSNDENDSNIPYDAYQIDSEIILDAVTQIITGDIFSIYKQNIDLNKWAANMESLYNKRFGDTDDNFEYWVDSMLDFLVGSVEIKELEDESDDVMWAIWAYNVIIKLEEYPKNKYLNVFIDSLNRWII